MCYSRLRFGLFSIISMNIGKSYNRWGHVSSWSVEGGSGLSSLNTPVSNMVTGVEKIVWSGIMEQFLNLK